LRHPNRLLNARRECKLKRLPATRPLISLGEQTENKRVLLEIEVDGPRAVRKRRRRKRRRKMMTMQILTRLVPEFHVLLLLPPLPPQLSHCISVDVICHPMVLLDP
jgi:hypothetical protein